MKNHTLLLLLLFLSFSSISQSKKSQDRAAIKSMTGCFEVTFNFAETFNYSQDEDYKPSDIKISKGLEWAQIIEDNNNKISIQHLLIVGAPQRQFIVKHWRQDWLYQNTDFYKYNGNNEWIFEQLDKKSVKKQWTQKVYQVDDSPRYEGSGTWVHLNGKSYWESTTPAPLPRREFSKRNDYNVTLRGNRHEITDFGWVHDQDNKKIIRESGKKDRILAEEKGYNSYVKVADSKCKKAQDWWDANAQSWEQVRSKWAEVFDKKQTLQLKKAVSGKPLFRVLFDKSYEFTEANVDQTIESFVK